MRIRILTAADVTASLPMAKAIEVMRSALGQLSAGQADVPQRMQVASEAGVTLCMPAYLRESRELAVKIVSVYGDNPTRQLPAVTASVLVLDTRTGLPKALVEGTSLTAIRTGAAGGLAAQLLARTDARTVALFGAGVQARAQLEGLMAVRRITQVHLISRTRSSADRLAEEVASWPRAPSVGLASTPAKALADADVVIAATTSSTPVFDGQGLRPGTHVTGVGSYTPQMQEVDAVTVARATVVVDSREACLAEAGDLIIPGAAIDAELGEIVNGVKPGRQSDDEITFFKSVGVAAQDAAAAAAVLEEAEERGLGTVVDL